jgi:hypothetical protein
MSSVVHHGPLFTDLNESSHNLASQEDSQGRATMAQAKFSLNVALHKAIIPAHL